MFLKILFSTLSFFTLPLLAQENSQSEESRLYEIIDGTNISTRWRYQTSNGVLNKNQEEYRVDLKLQFKIDSSGKLVLRSRVLTGPRYDGAWNDLGIGNHSRPSANVAMRLLYLDYSPTSHINIQGGALPTLPTDIKSKTPLSLDGDGWIDNGGRLAYSKLSKWADKIVVTAGHVGNYETPQFTDRDWNSINFLQIHIQGNLTKRWSYLVEPTIFEKRTYLRLLSEINTKDVIPFVDNVVIEELLQNRIGHAGFSSSLKKEIKGISITGLYSYKSATVSSPEEGFLQLEHFYRRGHQISVRTEKAIPSFDKGPIQGFNAFINAAKIQPILKVNPSDVRVEGGIQFRLGKSK